MKIQKIDEKYEKSRKSHIKILLDIYHTSNAKNLYRIDIDTTKLIENSMKVKQDSNHNFSIKPEDYISNTFKNQMRLLNISYPI